MKKKRTIEEEFSPEEIRMLGGSGGAYVPPELRPRRRKLLRMQSEAEKALPAAEKAMSDKNPSKGR